MYKIIFCFLFTLQVLSANYYTLQGEYLGEECEDLCYVTFKTELGNISINSPDGELYNELKLGKSYKVTYEKTLEFMYNTGERKLVDNIKSIEKKLSY